MSERLSFRGDECQLIFLLTEAFRMRKMKPSRYGHACNKEYFTIKHCVLRVKYSSLQANTPHDVYSEDVLKLNELSMSKLLGHFA